MAANTVINFSDVDTESPTLSGYTGADQARYPEAAAALGFGEAAIGQAVASQVWLSGTQKAKKYASIYGNIDILRPYFDVEPRTVIIRLFRSFMPMVKARDLPSEMYGPSMLSFTLVALLLYSMKSASHTVKEGTLIGTAMGVCFGYWIAVSLLLFCISYLCGSAITCAQVSPN